MVAVQQGRRRRGQQRLAGRKAPFRHGLFAGGKFSVGDDNFVEADPFNLVGRKINNRAVIGLIRYRNSDTTVLVPIRNLDIWPSVHGHGHGKTEIRPLSGMSEELLSGIAVASRAGKGSRVQIKFRRQEIHGAHGNGIENGAVIGNFVPLHIRATFGMEELLQSSLSLPTYHRAFAHLRVCQAALVMVGTEFRIDDPHRHKA